MNRTLIGLALGAAFVGGGFLLADNGASKGDPLPFRRTAEGDAVFVFDPSPEQCPVLLEGGGDRWGEATGIDDRDEHEVARTLLEMQAAGAITLAHFQSGLQAGEPAVACRGTVFLSSRQVERTKRNDDDGDRVRARLEKVGAPVTGKPIRVEMAGGAKADDFAVADDATPPEKARGR